MTAAWSLLPSDMCLPQLSIPGLAQLRPAWHQVSLAPSLPAAEADKDERRALFQASCQLANPDLAVSLGLPLLLCSPALLGLQQPCSV